MSFSFFIANRIAMSRQKSFTGVVIRIAIAAIALSVSIMILTTSLIDGFRSGITGKIFGFWGHINITHVSVHSNLDNVPVPAHPDYYAVIDTLGRLPFYRDERDEERGREQLTRGGVSHIQAYALLPGIIKTRESLEGIILKGCGSDFRWDHMQGFLQEGEIINTRAEEASESIVISRITADRLQIGVGEKIILHFVQGDDQLRRRFTVSGIYKTGLNEYDDKLALVDIRKVTQILGWEENQVGGFEVFLEDLNDLDVFADYLYFELLPADQYAEPINRRFSQIFDWLELNTINERFILLLMVIVSIINMITALLILILERTNMIGILSAVGATQWRIRKIFLYHAAYIILTGLLAGNLIGFGLGWIQDRFGLITLDESSYYLSVAPIQFDLFKILLINAGTFLITIISLILPTYLISRIDPVKAIRFK
jgi:lipoprotein-releasing system permease protein